MCIYVWLVAWLLLAPYFLKCEFFALIFYLLVIKVFIILFFKLTISLSSPYLRNIILNLLSCLSFLKEIIFILYQIYWTHPLLNYSLRIRNRFIYFLTHSHSSFSAIFLVNIILFNIYLVKRTINVGEDEKKALTIVRSK